LTGARRNLRVIVALGCAAALAAGCAATQEPVAVPMPDEAQWVWNAYWTAVERGDVGEWNSVVHSSIRSSEAQGFDPRVREDARLFLKLCSVQSESMAVGGDRASYRTRCADAPTQSGLYPSAGAEIVLRRDVDGVWRFFCFGCGLPFQPESSEEPPSPHDAQRLWVAFWSAVERGDPVETRQLLHSRLADESAQAFGRPEMRGEARSFLYQCSIPPGPPIVSGERARYRTRCQPRGGGGDMLLERDRDGVWKVLCLGGCPL
jgi:hypothetical protein